MDCKKCNHLLFDYVEGKLSEELEDLVAAHLSNCAGCHKEAKILRNALNLIDQQKSVPVNPFFYTRVEARLDDRGNISVQTWHKAFQSVVYSLMLAFAIWIGIFLGTPGNNRIPVNEEEQWVSILREEYNLDSDSETMLENFTKLEVE